MRIRSIVIGISTLALVLVGTSFALGSSMRRASEDALGGDPNNYSSRPSISADGRYVAFGSLASDLVVDDGNSVSDVFVRDLVTGDTVRASVDTQGTDGNDHSFDPSISADGRYVAFHSSASDLVSDDGTGDLPDIFVRDLVTETTIRASVDMDGGDPNDGSYRASISANGRSVAFYSYASDLVADDSNGRGDVFVRDLDAGTTERASVDTQGGNSNDHSFDPSISAGGRYIAFQSLASDLVPNDGNSADDVFVRDLSEGTTVRASVDTGGGDPNDISSAPSISASGRYVSFSSEANDLVADDSNTHADIFVRDLTGGTTIRASVDSGGGDPDGDSSEPAISSRGRYVAFESFASDLVPEDGNGRADIFVRDLVLGTTIRASVDIVGGDPDADSRLPSINGRGQYVAFESGAGDLVPHDGNGTSDIFVWWRRNS